MIQAVSPKVCKAVCNVAPCCVFNVVGFIKDEDSIVHCNVHGGADDRIQQVIVGAEDHLCILCMHRAQVSGD